VLNDCEGDSRKKHTLYYLSMARNTAERNLKAVPSTEIISIILWHENPLLGNECEISKFTTAFAR
jgi:hypothetical protein